MTFHSVIVKQPEQPELRQGMSNDITIVDIINSLYRRGFYHGQDIQAALLQTAAVTEEHGEVCRMLRRWCQGRPLEEVKLIDEAADVVIASVCLLATVAGASAPIVIAEKLAQDEKRGWLHQGGPLLEGGAS